MFRIGIQNKFFLIKTIKLVHCNTEVNTMRALEEPLTISNCPQLARFTSKYHHQDNTNKTIDIKKDNDDKGRFTKLSSWTAIYI